MNLSDDQVQTIVNRVVQDVLKSTPVEFKESVSEENWGVFQDMDDAVEAAYEAFLLYEKMGIQDRKKFTDCVRQVTLDFKEEFSRMAIEQTGMGRLNHKIAKHENVAKHASGIEFLQPECYSGKNGLAIDEYAPWGVIGNISPSTHPSPTMLENIITQLSAGNTIVFNPHPASKGLNAYVIERCNQYMVKAGAPRNLVTCVSEPTLDSAKIMFGHSKTRLLSVTGGPGVVAEAMKYEKPVIAAGPGNPPVLIDETADLELAAKEITWSGSFDNNILCIAEKEIFVVDSVFNSFIKAFERQGNKMLISQQMDHLADKVLEKSGKHYLIRRDFVGRNANILAKVLGLQLADEVPLLFGETEAEHPWVVAEQMTSCIPVVRVQNFEQGIEEAKKAEHHFEHTSSVFTKDMNRATAFAKELKTDIIVINGGTLRGNGGDFGESSFSHTIASPTGQGITNPRDFCRHRRIMTAGAFRFV
ncbi:aldehyde dehydrogenase [bacterium]|nr:aldehyde dehydrogenase [candidate division CSSED10-310 bacterium]